jgi:DME family drug/metabolite transporter
MIGLAAMLWGTVGIVSRMVYQGSSAPATTIGFFRLALAAPALLAACTSLRGRGLWVANRRDIGVIALIGAMLAFYQLCFVSAVISAGVTVATLVTLCTAPILVAALDTAITGERPGRRELGAMAAALLGTGMLVGAPSAAGPGMVMGVLLALGSGLGYAVMLVAGRSVAGRAHPLQTNALAFSVGALLLLICTLPSGPGLRFSGQAWGLLAYLGLVPTALAYVLFLRGIRDIRATQASIVTLVEPLTAALLAAALFGERLTLLGWLGAALLVGALAMLALGAARS